MQLVTRAGPFGELLRDWRKRRHFSQLDLSLEAEVSARHISFLETGRAKPSREMVIGLAACLEIPLRDRNQLLTAAGFAPVYGQTSLDDPDMHPVRELLSTILEATEPNGAMVVDRYWNVIMANGAAQRLTAHFIANPAALAGAPLNAYRLVFSPDLLRPHIGNWEQVASLLIDRLYRELKLGEDDPKTRELFDEIMGYPDVPARFSGLAAATASALVLPLQLEKGSDRLHLVSTITTVGTPQDVTLDELRIESFYPADPESMQARDRLLG